MTTKTIAERGQDRKVVNFMLIQLNGIHELGLSKVSTALERVMNVGGYNALYCVLDNTFVVSPPVCITAACILTLWRPGSHSG